MLALFNALIFLIGIFVGSFLNVLVDRLPKGANPFKGRSHCDNCKHTLSPLDLIPLLSFFLLRGKCRYCKKKLSYYYPLVEIVTGFMFLGVLGLFGSSGILGDIYTLTSIVYYILITSILIIIFFTDLKYGIIPFNVVVFGTVFTIIFLTLIQEGELSFLNHIYSAMGAFLFFLLIFLITRGRGIGFGDVIYVLFMGLLLGFPKIILGLYIAFISGALISVVLVILKKKKLRGSTIPFGPFLVAGTVLAIFWGDSLLSLILPYLLIR